MNRTASETERMQRLLEVVEQQRERRCAEILQQAGEQARQLLQQARGKARVRLHREILHARQQYSHQAVLQQASQAARQRQARFRADHAWLEQAWSQLRAALERRWQDPAARAVWVESLAARALARLVGVDWQIRHPQDWPQGEREALAARLNETLGRMPAFAADADLRAGICIRAGETVVDGSCDGLLRDRVHIEALLLAGLRETEHG